MIGRIGLVVHGGKPMAVAAAERVRQWAAQHAVPCVDIDVWRDGAGDSRLDAAEEASRAGRPDLIVTVGGDGTFLRGVRIATASDSVVLGGGRRAPRLSHRGQRGRARGGAGCRA